ncbi:integrase domain-containing protein [Paraburkholderia azotifigens]|uniref:Integrase domain-containing protein n=1 Tax=Paraburkholderia azotifigens TaxID=2057004 RepID=A0ABU9QZK0_9BURK
MKVQLDYQPFIKNAGLPQRLTNELAELFRLHLSKPHGKNTAVSNVISIQTQEYRVQVLTAGFRDLRKGGFAIESPWNLADKHIRYLVNLWVNEKKHSPGTVETRLTYWRTLAAWMKKHQLVGTMDDYIDRPNGYRRFYGAQEDKSGEVANVEVEEVIARLCERNRWVAMQVELQATFGLRAQESMLLRPLQCLRVTGHLHVTDGTARGRPRVVPIDAEWQYDVLVRAARLANPRTGSMIPDPWSRQQWYYHFYYILNSVGIKRGADGLTIDCLRHAYLRLMSERVRGAATPTKRPDHQTDPEVHQAAIERLMEVAGRGVGAKARACISAFATIDRRSRAVVSAEEAIAALAAASGNKSQAAKSLRISRQALYRLLANCRGQPATSR